MAAAFAAAGIDDWEPLVRQDERFFRPADPTELVGDASRARDVLGWEPTLTNGEMLLKSYRYYHRNRQEIAARKDVSAHRQATKMGVIRVLKFLS